MPDEWGETLYELDLQNHDLRAEIETMWFRWAQRVHRRTGNPTDLLELKEFQRQCPNLPPIRRG